MAIAPALQSKIIALADEHWSVHVRDRAFAEIVSGKEPGHRMADYVDDRTTALLKVHFDTRYEGTKTGETRKRSMGDIWAYSNGMYNPINVKSGLQDMKGQPNLVSMQKLLRYILKQWIDSYYLLIIKFNIADRTHVSYFVDLLDWTDYVTYDAGPGQIMLREQEFYAAVDSGHVPAVRSVPDKAEDLFRLFESKLNDLFRNRQETLRRQRNLLHGFRQVDFTVDQSDIRFVP